MEQYRTAQLKGHSIQTEHGEIIGIAYQIQCRWRSEYGANKPDLPTQQSVHAITREGFHPLFIKVLDMQEQYKAVAE